ncbi:MAG: hypothetical protein U9N35_04470 [Euryarchaeota archaeon]|nr:hypothetical protein [Euryarchaeota archaeon]
MDNKRKILVAATILLVIASSIAYAENQEDEKKSGCPCEQKAIDKYAENREDIQGCPCEQELRGGCVPDEPQMGRGPIKPMDCGTRTWYEYKNCSG